MGVEFSISFLRTICFGVCKYVLRMPNCLLDELQKS